MNELPYCIVRTYSAGVYAGYVESRDGKEAVMRDARMLWYWDGAASLAQIAVSGVTKPKNCKFTITMPRLELTEVISVMECTPEAQANIAEVSPWLIK